MNYLGLIGLAVVGFNRLNKCSNNIQNGLPAFTNKDLLEIGLFLSTYGLSRSFNYDKQIDDVNNSITIGDELITIFN